MYIYIYIYIYINSHCLCLYICINSHYIYVCVYVTTSHQKKHIKERLLLKQLNCNSKCKSIIFCGVMLNVIFLNIKILKINGDKSKMLIKIFPLFLYRSINIIMDLSYNMNLTHCQVQLSFCYEINTK